MGSSWYAAPELFLHPGAKVGKLWQDDELDAIVCDYFDMLEADVSGRSYVKSRHSRALMDRIGRTHRSAEFKHQNISAVLDELGLPWIPGYVPKRNYQNALFDAIVRYRVHLFAKSPRVFTVAPPLEQSLVLRPETWRASF
jgi:hypothetical protein